MLKSIGGAHIVLVFVKGIEQGLHLSYVCDMLHLGLHSFGI